MWSGAAPSTRTTVADPPPCRERRERSHITNQQLLIKITTAGVTYMANERNREVITRTKYQHTYIDAENKFCYTS